MSLNSGMLSEELVLDLLYAFHDYGENVTNNLYLHLKAIKNECCCGFSLMLLLVKIKKRNKQWQLNNICERSLNVKYDTQTTETPFVMLLSIQGLLHLLPFHPVPKLVPDVRRRPEERLSTVTYKGHFALSLNFPFMFLPGTGLPPRLARHVFR